MSTVKRNIVANLFGSGWTTLLTIAVTPIQVRVLGIEAFGVVGFIATLQIAFTAFDLGLSSTLTRELAADRSVNKINSAELLRTAGTVYWASAAIVGTALAGSAAPLAHNWFKVAEIETPVLERSLQVVALYLALRWPVALYSGILAGLQRMDSLNTVKIAAATLRLVGGVAVLLYWRTLNAFLLWTSCSAMLEVAAYCFVCKRVHPTMPLRPGISLPALKRVWRFSMSMNALATLAVLIVQLDRLFISKMLTLDALGFYSLAYNAAAGISLIVAAIGSAVMPSFAAAHSQGASKVLVSRYEDANRIMLFMTGLAVFAFVFYGEFILALWVDSAAAAGAYVPLALLSVGFWCSAAIANVYNLAVGAGMPGRLLKVNLAIVVPYALVLAWMIASFGIKGAGAAWILLNVTYAILLVPALHQQILGMSTSGWLLRTVLPFAALGMAAYGSPRVILGLHASSHGTLGEYLAAMACSFAIYLLLGYFLLGKRIRESLRLGLMFRNAH